MRKFLPLMLLCLLTSCQTELAPPVPVASPEHAYIGRVVVVNVVASKHEISQTRIKAMLILWDAVIDAEPLIDNPDIFWKSVRNKTKEEIGVMGIEATASFREGFESTPTYAGYTLDLKSFIYGLMSALDDYREVLEQ